MKKLRTKKKKGSIDRAESFDQFLAAEGLLAETEDAAIKKNHRRSDQGGNGQEGPEQDSNGGTDAD